MSCRNTKKPTKAKWLLGEDYPTAVDIESKGFRPRMTWRMSDKIKRWSITWRDSTPTNPIVSLGINGDLGSAIMMSHGMTLLALTSTPDERWENALAALLAVHPIWASEGEDDYIAVVLDAKFCHIELCARAQDKGLQFPNGYADDKEDVVYAYTTVEAAMEQVNKERLQAASKPNKRARTKKSDAVGGALEIADETTAMGESSRPKRKNTAGGGEREASRAKKSDGKLSFAAAILQANNLTSKTKPSEVEAMYKSLEEGLGQCFPYGQDPLPCKILAHRIHLAPDSLKYCVYFEKWKDQVQLEAKALGTIQGKPELYCIPLKRAPVKGGGPNQEGQEIILEYMPPKDMEWAIDGVSMPWYQADMHWYIVGGQHTYQACVSIAAKEVPGSAQHKFYSEFDVIPVYSRDLDMLIKVSNALNIQVKDKVVTENFRSQLGYARAKWIEKGRLRPKKGGAKHDPAFKVIFLKHITPPFQNFENQCHCILYWRIADIH